MSGESAKAAVCSTLS